MTNKATLNARMIFAWMVPMTVAAFLIGAYSTVSIRDNQQVNLSPGWADILGLLTATGGVLLFNWYEEKPQKASIENL